MRTQYKTMELNATRHLRLDESIAQSILDEVRTMKLLMMFQTAFMLIGLLIWISGE